ncbi:S-layer homology domain-containing protein [Domibacillus robiginosus]|uniref:S-layer homology domain-containing protein n=1 Tax=Domibacillus robiginosus TaxID=1071054 RepID=UPI00067E360C|nr:S-layer homology domain-containing protein [Domibacillus robiginosus]
MKKCLAALLFSLLVLAGTQQAFATNAFSDLRQDHWAREEIYFLSNEGVISGYSNGKFGANDTIKRHQMAIMLGRALDLGQMSAPNPGFKDVNTKTAGYKDIAALVEQGVILKGEYFKPNAVLTRGEMAVYLQRAFNLKVSGAPSFKDIPSTHTRYNAIAALQSNGVTAKYADGTFRENEPVTRAQFAAFFARVMDDRFKVTEQSLKEDAIKKRTNEILAGMQKIMLGNMDLKKGVAKPFANIEKKLAAYATTSYIQNEAKYYYAPVNPSTYNLYPRAEVEQRFRILSQTDTKIVFESITKDHYKFSQGIFYAKYELVLQSGKWLLNDLFYEYEPFNTKTVGGYEFYRTNSPLYDTIFADAKNGRLKGTNVTLDDTFATLKQKAEIPVSQESMVSQGSALVYVAISDNFWAGFRYFTLDSNGNYRIKDNEPVAIVTHITPAFTADYSVAFEYLKSLQPTEQWTHHYESPYPLVESYDFSNGNSLYIDSRVSPAGLEVSVVGEG